ncbi:GGDEF domain-containing protein [Sphingomonas sp. PB1R3]|uniref:GGDEF domain-containing protein n=1 Tax=Sphingomonas flavida TaxID=3096154 RepID=UPI002FC6CCC4
MKRPQLTQTAPCRIDPDVYAALISDLAYSAVPTAIMGITLVGIASLAWLRIGNPVFALAALTGAAGTGGKLFLMSYQREALRNETHCASTARFYQQRHLVVTLATATSIAATVSLLFFHIDAEWHVLGTALLFAYCAGVVARLAVCPALAVAALIVAAVPVIVACCFWSDVPHRVTAAMFAVFLAGSFETVRHVYRNAVRHIATELDMATLARNDPLTGLLNRLGFREAFRVTSGTPGGLAIHCFDLDGFKPINDCHGHAAGDQVLVDVARRIRASAPGAAAARLGGDEFAILQGGVACTEDAISLADQLLATLRKPYDIGDTSVYVGASLGFAVAYDDGMDFDALVRAADLASYQVKRAGGGVSQGHVDHMDRLAGGDLRIVT